MRFALLALFVTGGAACAVPGAGRPVVTYVDEYTLVGERNFLTGYDTINADGSVNVVVEIPTGTSQKWEICKSGSIEQPGAFPGCSTPGREMVVEVRDGRRRVVAHLGYPGNYGSLPGTLAEDGDPLDAIVIGPAAERGTVIPVKVVGVLRCVDGGEQDDKIVAVAPASPLFDLVSTAADLQQVAPGAAEILHRWFESYKPAGKMSCAVMADERVAAALIAASQAAFGA